jgi:nitronate monooxygenase
MWMNTALTRRANITYPIVQGPFGGGLSSVRLTAAVSEAGGLGSYGANYLPGDKIRAVVDEIRSLTTRPFAINLWVPQGDLEMPVDIDRFDKAVALFAPYFEELSIAMPSRPNRFGQVFREQIEAALAARPPLLTFVFGVPSTDILQACRDRGILTAGTATTVEEALAIEAAGVDFVVASGFEAGGHRGSFLKPPGDSFIGTFALVRQVARRVRIPVIAAGGIADGAGIAAALALGADAVQIGTAFLACQESGANNLHREMLFSPRASDTVLSKVFSGRLARGVRNELVDAMRPHEATLPPFPVQNWLTGLMRERAIERGRSGLIALSAGQAASLVRRSEAARLMRDLIEETENVLRDLTDGGSTSPDGE